MSIYASVLDYIIANGTSYTVLQGGVTLAGDHIQSGDWCLLFPGERATEKTFFTHLLGSGHAQGAEKWYTAD